MGGVASSMVKDEGNHIKDSANSRLDKASGKNEERDYLEEMKRDLETMKDWTAQQTDMQLEQYKRDRVRNKNKAAHEDIKNRYRKQQTTQDRRALMERREARYGGASEGGSAKPASGGWGSTAPVDRKAQQDKRATYDNIKARYKK